jgi:hypothetical protein
MSDSDADLYEEFLDPILPSTQIVRYARSMPRLRPKKSFPEFFPIPAARFSPGPFGK